MYKIISVNITGGSIQGYTALYESNPQNNTTMDKVSIKISGGEFETKNGGTEAIKSENKTGFITGGTFNSTVVEKYLSSEVTAEKAENGEILVGTRYDIEVKEKSRKENKKVVISLIKEKIEELKHKDSLKLRLCYQHDNKALAQIQVLEELLKGE